MTRGYRGALAVTVLLVAVVYNRISNQGFAPGDNKCNTLNMGSNSNLER